MEYAGFWRRFVAYIIDGLILGIIEAIFISAKMPYAVLFVGWLYYALMESSSTQATLGKMALGLYVTDLNGDKIGFGRATGRYFGKIISGLILFVGFMMAGWTARKQALHDIMAETLVLKRT
ncbi:RDD family protein [Thermoanaerobacterium butyriciformans]|uniref:RDD family membrane protein YckC n=1 Tax=Thermoanaerobacterium butyriciformans TaxID=1702242 RepID=A0ABS4NCW4_9THEO|nr:RDD family protein [Thermoanaerobacterium butyriciformans]MBP2070853.1 putative RDD family membrane protein YckC [Thermoanaerobacterium butyriciformans]